MYDYDGNRMGYMVPRSDGGMNFFDNDGNRFGYESRVHFFPAKAKPGEVRLRIKFSVAIAAVALTAQSALAADCGALRAYSNGRVQASVAAAQKFLAFTGAYGTETIARDPKLWVIGQMLSRRAQDTTSQAIASGEAVLAAGCISEAGKTAFLLNLQQIKDIQEFFGIAIETLR
jgi:hypothetical protein